LKLDYDDQPHAHRSTTCTRFTYGNAKTILPKEQVPVPLLWSCHQRTALVLGHSDDRTRRDHETAKRLAQLVRAPGCNLAVMGCGRYATLPVDRVASDLTPLLLTAIGALTRKPLIPMLGDKRVIMEMWIGSTHTLDFLELARTGQLLGVQAPNAVQESLPS